MSLKINKPLSPPKGVTAYFIIDSLRGDTIEVSATFFYREYSKDTDGSIHTYTYYRPEIGYIHFAWLEASKEIVEVSLSEEDMHPLGWDPSIYLRGASQINHQALIDFYLGKNVTKPEISFRLYTTSHLCTEVWSALLNIRLGQKSNYQDIAKQTSIPRAYQAVGNAVGHNPISLFIPCHRVFPKKGGIGGYAHGERLKRRLLTLEGYLLDLIEE